MNNDRKKSKQLREEGYKYIGRQAWKPERKFGVDILTTQDWLDVDVFEGKDGSLVLGDIYPENYVQRLCDFGFVKVEVL